MSKGKTETKVLHFDGEKFTETTVALIKEEPLTIHLNEQEFITLLCYPDNLQELVAGFLKSEGLLNVRSDVRSIRFSRDGKHAYVDADIPEIDKKLHEKRLVTTGCGKGSVFYYALDALKSMPQKVRNKWNFREIIATMKEINRSKGSKSLGGLHVCGFYDGEELVIREDIGRHNALDKIVGFCFLNDVAMDDGVVYTSGRISSEILIKAAKIGAGMIVSRSTPTELACGIAEKLNITLVGYVRGDIMTVYTAKERIITE